MSGERLKAETKNLKIQKGKSKFKGALSLSLRNKGKMSKQAGVSIGMMDQAYFVGRKAILQWLNDLLLTDFKKVEETANGKFFSLSL